jgi:hypothetical protein
MHRKARGALRSGRRRRADQGQEIAVVGLFDGRRVPPLAGPGWSILRRDDALLARVLVGARGVQRVGAVKHIHGAGGAAMICRALCAVLWHLWPLFGTGCGPAPWLVVGNQKSADERAKI